MGVENVSPVPVLIVVLTDTPHQFLLNKGSQYMSVDVPLYISYL